MEHGSTDKNKTSYTATASPRPHKIASLDRAPPLPLPDPPPLVFVYSCLSLLFVYPCLSSPLVQKMTLQRSPSPYPSPPATPHTQTHTHTSATTHPSPSLPSFLPVAPSYSQSVCYCVRYWRPYYERARRRQIQPQASPGDPRLTAHNPSGFRISTVCCWVHTDQPVSSSRINLLSRLPVLIPPWLPHVTLSGICVNGWPRHMSSRAGASTTILYHL